MSRLLLRPRNMVMVSLLCASALAIAAAPTAASWDDWNCNLRCYWGALGGSPRDTGCYFGVKPGATDGYDHLLPEPCKAVPQGDHVFAWFQRSGWGTCPRSDDYRSPIPEGTSKVWGTGLMDTWNVKTNVAAGSSGLYDECTGELEYPVAASIYITWVFGVGETPPYPFPPDDYTFTMQYRGGINAKPAGTKLADAIVPAVNQTWDMEATPQIVIALWPDYFQPYMPDCASLAAFDTARFKFMVHNPDTTPTCDIEADPPTSQPPLVPYTFTATACCDPIVAYAWDFGDGNTATGNPVTHAYTAAGTYFVTCMVTDIDGDVAVCTWETTTDPCLPPVCCFTFAPDLPHSGETVQFTDCSTAQGISWIVAWHWDFGDGGTDTTQNPTHQYDTRGEYNVCLTVTNDCGQSATCCDIVYVQLPPPFCSISYTPTDPTAADVVTFTATPMPPEVNVVAWDWDFGDGHTAGGNPVAHRYAAAGTYMACCTGTDDQGNSGSCAAPVDIGPAPPICCFSGPGEITIGQEACWDDCSTDPDGFIASRAWYLDSWCDGLGELKPDGGFETGFHDIQDQPCVGDSGVVGNGWTPWADADCGWMAPYLYFDATTEKCEGDHAQGVQFEIGSKGFYNEVTGLTPGKTYLVSACFRFDTDVDTWWAEFGVSDADPPVPGGGCTSPDDPYPGDPWLFKQDGWGLGPPPGAWYTCGPYRVTPTGSSVIIWYKFGGNPGNGVGYGDAVSVVAAPDGTDLQFCKVFTSADLGWHVLTLAVTDNDGLTACCSLQISADGLPPTCELAVDPAAPNVGDTVTLTETAACCGPALTYDWDFECDGVVDTTTVDVNTATHVYTSPGDYVACVKVTNSLGQSCEAFRDVFINAPPVCIITGPVYPDAGEPACFSGADSHDPDGGALTYDWDFGDGSGDVGEEPCHIYTQWGTYDVILCVTDDEGTITCCMHSVEVQPVEPPVWCFFSWSPADPTDLDTVQFTDESFPADVIVAWAWDFGDGGTSNEQHPTHWFIDDGVYTVCSVITYELPGESPATSTCCNQVTVSNIAPICWIAGPTSGQPQWELCWDAGATDLDGVVVSYRWDFGDQPNLKPDGGFEFGFDTPAAWPCPDKDSGVVGSGWLPWADGDCGWMGDYHYFDSTTVVCEGEHAQGVEFDNGSRGFYNEVAVTPGQTYLLTACVRIDSTDCYWAEFGCSDGDPPVPGGGCTSLDDPYPDEPWLWKSDGWGLGPPAGAWYTAGPYRVTPTGNSLIVWYKFGNGCGLPSTGYGDGVTLVLVPDPVTEPFACHTYESDGVFDVCVTVTDDDGASAICCQQVTIEWGHGMECYFTPEPEAAYVCDLFEFEGGGSDPGGVIVSWDWDFGDGAVGSGQTSSHRYSAPGVYTVTLMLTDDDGNTGHCWDSVVVWAGSDLDWNCNLRCYWGALDSSIRDTACFFGVKPGATDGYDLIDSLKPPEPMGDYVYAWFYRPTWGAPSDNVVADWRSPIEEGTSKVWGTGITDTWNVKTNLNGGLSSYFDPVCDPLNELRYPFAASIYVDWEFGVSETRPGPVPPADYFFTMQYKGGINAKPPGTKSADATVPVMNQTWDMETTPHIVIPLWDDVFQPFTAECGMAASDAARFKFIVTNPQTMPPLTCGVTVSGARECGAPLTFNANAAAIYGVASVAWDFGDGSTASGDPVTHAYAAWGTYLATCTVTDECGLTVVCDYPLDIAPTTMSFFLTGPAWHMISLPCDIIDPDPWEVFDELRPPNQPVDLLSGSLHRYDPVLMGYRTWFQPLPGAFGGPLRIGEGYWLWVHEDVTIEYEACCPPGERAIHFPAPGWYMIGNPCPHLVDMRTDQVQAECGDSGRIPYRDAVPAWFGDPLVGYDPTMAGYYYVSVGTLIAFHDLRPFEGYWIDVKVAPSTLYFMCSETLP